MVILLCFVIMTTPFLEKIEFSARYGNLDKKSLNYTEINKALVFAVLLCLFFFFH